MSRHICRLVIVLIIFVAGCGMSLVSRTAPAVTPVATTTAALVAQQVKSTDFLNTLFLLALVGSVFAALNGLKVGWAGAAASLVGIVLKGALTQTWIYWMLGVLLIGTTVLIGASIILKKRVITELIQSAQRLKKVVRGAGNAEDIANPFQDQSPDTKKVVAQVKAELKTKGQI